MTCVQAFLKYKPSLLVAVPSQAGYDDVQCFSFNSNAPELELEPVEYVPGPVSNHLVQNTVMIRLSASLPLYLTNDEKGNITYSGNRTIQHHGIILLYCNYYASYSVGSYYQVLLSFPTLWYNPLSNWGIILTPPLDIDS